MSVFCSILVLCPIFKKEKFLNISLPEIKYCITIPTKLENNIYIAKPEGNCQVNTPNIIGIIHKII